MTTLEWRKRQHGINAYLGRIRCFSLQWGLVRNKEKPWNLYCFLPGYEHKVWPCADEATAEQLAARILDNWLAATGLGAASQETAPSEGPTDAR